VIGKIKTVAGLAGLQQDFFKNAGGGADYLNFSDFVKKIYPHLTGVTNQGWFIGELFTTAGSTFFTMHPAYGTDDYHVKVYNGRKPLNKKMKASFPRPIEQEKLAEYFDKRIGDESVQIIMKNFDIDDTVPVDKEKFVSALCCQFENFITESELDIDDTVAKEYSNLLSGIIREPIPQPIYTNDNESIDINRKSA
jgi:hypothetical protein